MVPNVQPIADMDPNVTDLSDNKLPYRGRSTLDGILSLFADVRAGEGLTSLLLMLNVFLLLTAYYTIKPVREALILGSAGAEIKAYTGAIQALMFMAIVPFYSSIANRVNRLHLINGVTAFFLSNLVVFYFLGNMNIPIAIPFFVWVGLFNLMLVAQVWAFANDIYTQEQGRRLFAITGIGSSLGAIFGSYIAGRFFEQIGPYSMMLLCATILIVCMVLTTMIHRRETPRTPWPEAAAESHRPVGGKGGFALIFQHRYLMLIAVMVLLTNVVNTTGEFILGKAVKLHAEALVASGGTELTQEAYIGKFYSNFFFWVNVLGAVFQLFVVSRIMKYIGIGRALLILPVIALGSYSLLLFAPVLGMVQMVKVFENSTDYSIQNTARHALFLRTSREAKYKAKTAVDNFFWRAGDTLSALLVFVGTQLAFGLRGFAMVNVFMVFVWVAIVVAIIRARKNKAQTRIEDLAA
jgi:AAA family ATP:ADP antiporter